MEGSLESIEGVWRSLKIFLLSLSEECSKIGSLSLSDERALWILHVPVHPMCRRPSRVVSWPKPSNGFVKLNVDGSYQGNPCNCGGGWIIQDSRGMFLGAFSAYFGHGTNNEAELRALKEGVALCKSLSFYSLEIECDSKLVVDWVVSGKCNV
ncbi:uncharacterized protein LOC122301702 [Carya illinoinensis]|uniref:uncharacterized protein LOC122301702 n=1 Tax=Carya illinoinensis TaxID=32201 RepID=UPI001C724898|nr:uncharacterized protein LOC122301702 [Carya illinoinensis]